MASQVEVSRFRYIDEIETNQKIVVQAQKKRTKFHQSLDSLNQALTKELLDEKFSDRPFKERLPNWKGIGGDRLDTSVFESAKYGNLLSGIDQELLQQISKTYNRQTVVNDFRSSLMERFFSIDSETRYRDVIRMMNILRQELTMLESFLLQEYSKTLEAIESKIKE